MKYFIKQSFILLLFFAGFISCCKHDKKSENKLPYCENERLLLSSFDTIKSLDYKLFEIQDSLKEKLKVSYNEDICCKDLRFNVLFEIDSVQQIPVSLNCYYWCDDCPVFIRERNDCLILINFRGEVAFEGELSSLDSLSEDLFKYYSELESAEYFPYSYTNLQIVIQWDFQVKREKFRKFIKEIIDGYLQFANKLSVNTYSIEICKLNKTQLLELSRTIPFNLKIGILEIVEIEDVLEDELEIDDVEITENPKD
ncbi:MAG: hypothetical protein ABFS35_15445 [Bacteroidota bacterium]